MIAKPSQISNKTTQNVENDNLITKIDCGLNDYEKTNIHIILHIINIKSGI